jgi:hypothetical protein
MKEGAGHAKKAYDADVQSQEREVRNLTRNPRIERKQRKAEWRMSKKRTRRGKNEEMKRQSGAKAAGETN